MLAYLSIPLVTQTPKKLCYMSAACYHVIVLNIA